MENNKLDKRTKWSYCIGATGRDMAYALISMFLLTYIQYTMKLTVAQYALILPKQHYANIFEIEDETLAKAAKLAKKIMTHEKDVLGCEGYNLVQNNGEVAGQTVFHFHMHLIPRYESDDNKNVIEWNHKEFTDDEMKKICDEMSM